MSCHVMFIYFYETQFICFQVNTHLTPRPILLTRHGESQDNVRGRIGGDPALRYILNFYSLK